MMPTEKMDVDREETTIKIQRCHAREASAKAMTESKKSKASKQVLLRKLRNKSFSS